MDRNAPISAVVRASRDFHRGDANSVHLMKATEELKGFGALIEGPVIVVVHRSDRHGAWRARELGSTPSSGGLYMFG